MKTTRSALFIAVTVGAFGVQTLSGQENLDFAPSDLADGATEASRGVGETIGGWLGRFASSVGGDLIRGMYLIAGDREGFARFNRQRAQCARDFTNQVTQVATETVVISGTEFATERLRLGQAFGEYEGAKEAGHVPTRLDTATMVLTEAGRAVDLGGSVGRAASPIVKQAARDATAVLEARGRARTRTATPEEAAAITREMQGRGMKAPANAVHAGSTDEVLLMPRETKRSLEQLRGIHVHEGTHSLVKTYFPGIPRFLDESIAYSVQLEHARARGFRVPLERSNHAFIIAHVHEVYNAGGAPAFWGAVLTLLVEAQADFVSLVLRTLGRPIGLSSLAAGRTISQEKPDIASKSTAASPKAPPAEITTAHVVAAQANPGQMISATNADFMSSPPIARQGGSISDFYDAAKRTPQVFDPRDGLANLASHSLVGLDVSVFHKGTTAVQVTKPLSQHDVHRERARALVARQNAEQARKELMEKIAAAAARPQPQAVASAQPTYSHSTPTPTYHTQTYPSASYRHSAPRQTYSHNSHRFSGNGSVSRAPLVNASRIANAASSWVRFGLNASQGGHSRHGFGGGYSGGHGRTIGH